LIDHCSLAIRITAGAGDNLKSLKDVFVEEMCIDLRTHIFFSGVTNMKTKEIEAEMILQELQAFRSKVEELTVVVRNYAKQMLNREHDVAAWIESQAATRRAGDGT